MRGVQKITERTGLIDGVGEEFSLDINKKKKSFCSLSTALCWLLITALIAFFVVSIFTSDSIANMTAQKQIDLLDEATILGNVSSGCQSQIIIMRHGEYKTPSDQEVEDEEGNKHLSKIGLERADNIPSLFDDGARWTLPTHIYAMKRDREGVREGDDQLNLREIETLKPLSKKSGVGIDVLYSEGGERQLAFHIFDQLGSGVLCGQSTVISWEQKRIPTLAQALGCGEAQGCPEKYKKREHDKVSSYYRVR